MNVYQRETWTPLRQICSEIRREEDLPPSLFSREASFLLLFQLLLLTHIEPSLPSSHRAARAPTDLEHALDVKLYKYTDVCTATWRVYVHSNVLVSSLFSSVPRGFPLHLPTCLHTER